MTDVVDHLEEKVNKIRELKFEIQENEACLSSLKRDRSEFICYPDGNNNLPVNIKDIDSSKLYCDIFTIFKKAVEEKIKSLKIQLAKANNDLEEKGYRYPDKLC